MEIKYLYQYKVLPIKTGTRNTVTISSMTVFRKRAGASLTFRSKTCKARDISLSH